MPITQPVDGKQVFLATAALLLLLFAATASFYGHLHDNTTSAAFNGLTSALLYRWTVP